MPLYQCLVPSGSIDAGERARLAEAITTVHTSVTGAPRGFVNVVFTEYEPSAYFTAGVPYTASVISGTIRAGRDRETRAELLTRLSEAWIAITGQDARSLLIGLNEVDPNGSRADHACSRRGSGLAGAPQAQTRGSALQRIAHTGSALTAREAYNATVCEAWHNSRVSPSPTVKLTIIGSSTSRTGSSNWAK